jgi:hypothetical protein
MRKTLGQQQPKVDVPKLDKPKTPANVIVKKEQTDVIVSAYK